MHSTTIIHSFTTNYVVAFSHPALVKRVYIHAYTYSNVNTKYCGDSYFTNSPYVLDLLLCIKIYL